jgi:hypothetical protein
MLKSYYLRKLKIACPSVLRQLMIPKNALSENERKKSLIFILISFLYRSFSEFSQPIVEDLSLSILINSITYEHGYSHCLSFLTF